MNFILTVVCALHAGTCPIPKGIRTDIKVKDKSQCESQARLAIAAYGFRESDFVITCKGK